MSSVFQFSFGMIPAFELGTADPEWKDKSECRLSRFTKPMQHIETILRKSENEVRNVKTNKTLRRWFTFIQRRVARAYRRVQSLPMKPRCDDSSQEHIEFSTTLILQMFQYYASDHSLASWQAVVVTILGWGWRSCTELKSGTQVAKKLTFSLQHAIQEAISGDTRQSQRREGKEKEPRKQPNPKQNRAAKVNRMLMEARERQQPERRVGFAGPLPDEEGWLPISSTVRLQVKKDTKIKLDDRKTISVTLEYITQTGNLDVELPAEISLRPDHTSA